MKKTKICQVVCDLTNGGVEAVIYNYFSHIDFSIFDLHIITYGITEPDCAKKFEDLGFTIHIIPPKRKGFIKSNIAMFKEIKNGNYALVQAHLTEWNFIPMFLSWLCRVKCRVSHSHMYSFPKGFVQKIILKSQIILGKVFATDFFACGEDAGKYLFGEKIFNAGRVIILINAIDYKQFMFNCDSRKRIREDLGIAENVFCVGHVGRFLEQKNHHFLIDIFAKYHQFNKNSILLMLGIGDLMPEIQKKVQNLGINDVVKFLGSRNDANEIYKAIDVFLLPSRYEGFPVSGLEAQVAGLNCLFANTITSKVKVSDKVMFLPIDLGCDVWVENLVAINRPEVLCERSLTCIKDAYDICVKAKEFQEFLVNKLCIKK